MMRRDFVRTLAAAGAVAPHFLGNVLSAAPAEAWVELFNGRSLEAWRVASDSDAWRVEDGCLVGHGGSSYLFYDGPLADRDLRNFELVAEVRTEAGADSGIFVHTRYQETGEPPTGYEVQIRNSAGDSDDDPSGELTGSLRGVRSVFASGVSDGEWCRLRIAIVGRRVRVWVNDAPTVDYVQPARPYRAAGREQRKLSRGTIALQAPEPAGRVTFRSVKVRLLPDDAETDLADRPSDEGYGVKEDTMDRCAALGIPVVDFHVHLRGGLTVDKAVGRQALTGVNVGVLKNIGRGWPIETDKQLGEFIESTRGKPVFVGLQVNDRDWVQKHSADLLGQLDFALGDTMIMPMPDDRSEPVKLWLADQYSIDDPHEWMKRYVAHNLRVLAEPITILANPTYLPPPVADRYDELWTDERMRQIIHAAVANGVALEINARSGLPHDRFVRMAKGMGAQFTFGTNNFQDRPIDMSRCFEAIDRYKLTRADLYLPRRKLAARLRRAAG